MISSTNLRCENSYVLLLAYIPECPNGPRRHQDQVAKTPNNQMASALVLQSEVLHTYNRLTNEEVKTQLCDHWFSNQLMLKG